MSAVNHMKKPPGGTGEIEITKRGTKHNNGMQATFVMSVRTMLFLMPFCMTEGIES